MPRTARACLGGVCYHAMNRGNARATVFHSEGDYAAFRRLIAQACEIVPLRVLAYCLMPNHFHLVLWPHGDGDLSRWMRWLLTSHVRRYHQCYGTSGHVWQGRFKAFPVEEGGHLLSVVRYVERNPLRANLVRRAHDWQWSSLVWSQTGQHPAWSDPGPTARPDAWVAVVNELQSEEELAALRRCANREAPYGGEAWVMGIAQRLGLESTLRPRGRPGRGHPAFPA